LKIVKVEIENFKPYNNIRLPDNNNQARELPEGTFLIYGNNSMGKTSFIQGMLWGLLGDDLICAQKRKSMVKAGESSCKVDIIFELGGTQFRVIRKLIIKKNKSKELLNREIDFDEEAVLSKKDDRSDDKFVTIINRSKPVNEEVERMLGVSADIIERTVYIKQKDVDRLALADPTELRKLITTLFGLDEFDRLKNDLARMASDLQDSINVLKVEVESLNAEKHELVKRTEELRRKEQELKGKESELTARTDELSILPSEDILIKIKTNEDSVSTKNNQLALIKGSIREKTSYMANQTERIASLENKVLDLEGQKAHAEYTLQTLTSVENLRNLQALLSSIRLFKSQIMTLINRSHITLDFNPISYPE
jgi:DNA repair exonuclease SbcCD ATPase subunit